MAVNQMPVYLYRQGERVLCWRQRQQVVVEWLCNQEENILRQEKFMAGRLQIIDLHHNPDADEFVVLALADALELPDTYGTAALSVALQSHCWPH